MRACWAAGRLLSHAYCARGAGKALSAVQGPICDASTCSILLQLPADDASWRQPFQQHQQRRGMQLFKAFSKEAKEERRKKLNEDLQRGYWDDFKQLKDGDGKMFRAPDRLIPVEVAPEFPKFQAVRPDGSALSFPEVNGSAAAALVCIAFRAGAEDVLASWSTPFLNAAASQPNVAVYELSLVESVVMSIWPFRSIILRAAPGGSQRTAKGGADAAAVRHHYLFSFGDSEQLRRPLEMTNRLTGYVYLVDGQGRVRWRGSGAAEPVELDAMLRCTEELLAEARARRVTESLEDLV